MFTVARAMRIYPELQASPCIDILCNAISALSITERAPLLVGIMCGSMTCNEHLLVLCRTTSTEMQNAEFQSYIRAYANKNRSEHHFIPTKFIFLAEDTIIQAIYECGAPA